MNHWLYFLSLKNLWCSEMLLGRLKKTKSGLIVLAFILILASPALIKGIAAQHSIITSGYIVWDGYVEATGAKIYSVRESMWLSHKTSPNGTLILSAHIVREVLDIRKSPPVPIIKENFTVDKTLNDIRNYTLVFYNPDYKLPGLVSLLISPYSLFDVSNLEKLGKYLERGLTEVPGIIYDSWDIVFGTLRYVFYVELYTANKNYTSESILECIATIDKALGIVLNLRFSWYVRGSPFVLSLSISDTNLIPKHRLTITIVGIIAAIIAITYVVKRVRRKKRRR